MINEKDKTVVELHDAYVRFNMSKERLGSLKEYFIKLVRRELMFQEFYALKGINLTIKAGESWGFVGVNGSGKSTLLKLISGILKPYKGSVKIYGSIAPLIELGAGFDGEMTARENIFLNGTILGHSAAFMEEHFDEIVDFAGIGNFLDMPIKNYSSGMAARLGFSIATMVRPEILIIDEILSVGDYAFQQKCNARMQEMLSGGTTLLFVSHDIEQVKLLCSHAVWLDHGNQIMTGSSEDVCAAYIAVQSN